MVNCLRCTAATTGATTICASCQKRLRTLLSELTWLSAEVALTAAGYSRTGDQGHRKTPYRSRYELYGDQPLAEHIGDVDVDDASDRVRAQRDALRRILAAGGINPYAAEERDAIKSMLSTWARDINGGSTDGLPDDNAQLCVWLDDHADVIARHGAAEEFIDELEQRRAEALRVIDRRDTALLCGPCPTLLTHGYGQRECGAQIITASDSPTARCPQCHATYKTSELITWQVERLGTYTLAEIQEVVLPLLGRTIPARTLRHWAASGRLEIAGYDGDEPRYHVADVIELADSRPQTGPTGAQAHRCRA